MNVCIYVLTCLSVYLRVCVCVYVTCMRVRPKEFKRFGHIQSAKVVTRPDGSSKGYGFVCFSDRSAAVEAVRAMNGKAVHGKRLKTSLKKTPEECLKMQVDKLMEIADANRPFDPLQDCTLFVFHLPSDWDDSMLKEVRTNSLLVHLTILVSRKWVCLPRVSRPDCIES
eukprot:GHVU01156975.1.p2 GENE.GHVU01156975.1~~GHVU01156975.1.p2  ORF type:complete len:169 (-),score=8.89 GHVU01156975.1:1628-2134(-)